MFFKKKEEQKFEEFYEKFFKAFREEGNRLLSVINFFIDGILFLDEKQKIALINPKAEKILKIKSSNIFGQSPLRLNHFPNISPLVPFLAEKPNSSFQKEIKINDNLFLLIKITPIFSKNQFLGSIVVLKDITKEKMIEKTQSDFVTLAAHQFRTPSSAIKWALSMLLEEDLSNLTEKQKDTIKKVYNTNNRTITLINNLLDFTKMEKGRSLLKTSLLQIEDFLIEIVEKHKERINDKKIKLSLQLSPTPLPKLMLDSVKIKIALENILDNAIRYTPAKGSIDIYFKEKGDDIKIYFKDTGIGIPSSQQKKIFTHFFRAHNVHQVYTEGVGLGLFLTKSIIEAHGGILRFQSVENKGSLFIITLPIKDKFGEFVTEDLY